MFNKLKQFKELRSQAKIMHDILAKENLTVAKDGVSLVMTGNMEITSLTIDDDLPKNKLANTIIDCVNEAIKKTQKLMAEKVRAFGNFNNLRF